ncbi:hypothetical protein ACTA71_006427 [Dictyostelium dimigraforme]
MKYHYILFLILVFNIGFIKCQYGDVGYMYYYDHDGDIHPDFHTGAIPDDTFSYEYSAIYPTLDPYYKSMKYNKVANVILIHNETTFNTWTSPIDPSVTAYGKYEWTFPDRYYYNDTFFPVDHRGFGHVLEHNFRWCVRFRFETLFQFQTEMTMNFVHSDYLFVYLNEELYFADMGIALERHSTMTVDPYTQPGSEVIIDMILCSAKIRNDENLMIFGYDTDFNLDCPTIDACGENCNCSRLETGNECLVYECEEGYGCVMKDRVCEDYNPCTVDYCDDYGCNHIPIPNCDACTESFACISTDLCLLHLCASDLEDLCEYVPVECPIIDGYYGICNSSTGQCDYLQLESSDVYSGVTPTPTEDAVTSTTSFTTAIVTTDSSTVASTIATTLASTIATTIASTVSSTTSAAGTTTATTATTGSTVGSTVASTIASTIATTIATSLASTIASTSSTTSTTISGTSSVLTASGTTTTGSTVGGITTSPPSGKCLYKECHRNQKCINYKNEAICLQKSCLSCDDLDCGTLKCLMIKQTGFRVDDPCNTPGDINGDNVCCEYIPSCSN